jgi:hypothetical protein
MTTIELRWSANDFDFRNHEKILVKLGSEFLKSVKK